MIRCEWEPCQEPARYALVSTGLIERDDLLCGEHAMRERDNLLLAGSVATIEALPVPAE